MKILAVCLNKLLEWVPFVADDMHYFDLFRLDRWCVRQCTKSARVNGNIDEYWFQGQNLSAKTGEPVLFLSCTRSWETSYDLCLGQCLRISEVFCIFGASQQDCVECPPDVYFSWSRGTRYRLCDFRGIQNTIKIRKKYDIKYNCIKKNN